MSSNIPDWCKRAAEEIEGDYWSSEWPEGAKDDIAAIIAKHAKQYWYFLKNGDGDEFETQFRELVEASRVAEVHLGWGDCTLENVHNMLRRALEPFHE